MNERKLPTPGRFCLILLTFCAVLSVIIISFASLNLGVSFAMNKIDIDYQALKSTTPTEKILVYFNKDVDHGYREGNAREATGNADFSKIINNRINEARSTIELAVMYLEDENIISSLKQADKSGVKIRIITDHSEFTALQEKFADTTVQVIDNKGGIVQEGYKAQKSIMHYKFGLFDHADPANAYLITTSANWTDKDFDNNSNNLVVVQDQPIVLAYLDEFDQMWEGKFNRDKDLRSHRGEVFEIDGRRVELWMSPSEDPFTSFQMRYVNLLEAAKDSIYFAYFNFTLPRISQALEEKFMEGLEVKGIGNAGGWDINGSVFFDMRGVKHLDFNDPWTQIPFENIRHNGLEENSSFHYKYLLIDENIVATGASNMTVSAIFTNDEDTLIIHDPLIANEFKQNFFSHFRQYGGETRDSVVKIAGFNDENDEVVIENLTDDALDLKEWKIVTVEDTYNGNEYYHKNEFLIDVLLIPGKSRATVKLPDDFITDNNSEDEFLLSNRHDDGEIYLFDNFALLQSMVWY